MHTATASLLAESFTRDGYVVVRDLLAPTAVAGLRRAISRTTDAILAELHAAGRIPTTAPELPLERRLCVGGAHLKRYGRSWRNRLACREVFDLHRDPGLIGALHELLGDAVWAMGAFNGRPKLPGQDLTVVPMHQDSAYFGEDTASETLVTAWTPAVPVDAGNGCMEVVPESHRWGYEPHTADVGEGGFLAIRRAPPNGQVVVCAMQPGDVLFMHNLTWHRSGVNSSDGIRWSLDMRFHGRRPADARPLDPVPATRVDAPADYATWLAAYA